jgi:ATP-dependent DNA helicase RecG
MTPDELRSKLEELIVMPVETEWVEFKEAKNNIHFDDLGEYFSALSNEANLRDIGFGWLVLGITNSPPRKIVGTQYRLNRGDLDDLKKEIADHTTNRLSFEGIHELQLPEGRVLMFQIPAALQGVPIPWKGHYYGREGASQAPLSLSKIEQIRGQAIQDDWSAQICNSASLNDLDSNAVQFARKQYREKHPTQTDELDQWDDVTFLNKAKVCISGRITNAALILLGKEGSQHFLSPAISNITWVLKDAQGIEKDYEHFGPPLILAVDRVFAKIRNLTYRYMPNASLFPIEVTQYDSWVIRETLNNAIAHQDYIKASRINVVEEPESLLVTNVGHFIPGSVEEVILSDAPPVRYRNFFLSQAMVNLNMIDTIGSGIKRIFLKQRQRFFPMPDYDLSKPEYVKVRLFGKVLDENYTRLLIEKVDLSLLDVMALDKVQKGYHISKEEHKRLKRNKLIEGRDPNLFLSSKVASATGEEARHIRYRGFDQKYYKDIILELVKEHGPISRQKIDNLLMDKLPEVLVEKQKKTKIHNLLFILSGREKKIENRGSRKYPLWAMKSNKKQ